MLNILKKLLNRFKNIDLSGLLHHEEKIGGLAVDENGVFLTYLVKNKEGKEDEIFKKEISLPIGTIENGILKNSEAFLAGLKELQKNKPPSKSIIVSLPSIVVQPFIFEFFPNLKQEEINNAVSLIINSSLPLPPEKIYADWEEIKDENLQKKKVLLGMGLRGLIDPYLEVIKKADFAPVALETHSWSLGRLFNKNEPLMALNFESGGAVFSVFSGGSPVFQFNFSDADKNFLEKAAVFAERIMYFLASDNEYGFKIKNFLLLGDNETQNKFKNIFQKRLSLKFNKEEMTFNGDESLKAKIFSAGAAKRGLLPRYQDAICSLMPVGTELAYERQRFVSFLDFFQKFAIAFGGFFIILFLGTFLLINVVSRNAAKSLIEEQTIVLPELTSIKETAALFNEKMEQFSAIAAKSPKWENLFNEIDKLNNPGMIIGNLSVAVAQPVTISGAARDRDSLLQLKSTLENSPVFTAPPLPLSALIGKENIAFSFNLELKDGGLIYK